jgi:hypothetical protein
VNNPRESGVGVLETPDRHRARFSPIDVASDKTVAITSAARIGELHPISDTAARFAAEGGALLATCAAPLAGRSGAVAVDLAAPSEWRGALPSFRAIKLRNCASSDTVFIPNVARALFHDDDKPLLVRYD